MNWWQTPPKLLPDDARCSQAMRARARAIPNPRPPKPPRPVKFDVSLDDRRLRAALSEAILRWQDLTPAMRSIGELLVNSTRERFRDEEAPDGTRWAERFIPA